MYQNKLLYMFSLKSTPIFLFYIIFLNNNTCYFSKTKNFFYYFIYDKRSNLKNKVKYRLGK